jgi:hypothetical protein
MSNLQASLRVSLPALPPNNSSRGVGEEKSNDYQGQKCRIKFLYQRKGVPCWRLGGSKNVNGGPHTRFHVDHPQVISNFYITTHSAKLKVSTLTRVRSYQVQVSVV